MIEETVTCTRCAGKVRVWMTYDTATGKAIGKRYECEDCGSLSQAQPMNVKGK